jgi:hypothetical protein
MKNIITSYYHYRYHLKHKLDAYGILKSIESVKGKLSPKLTKLSDEYAHEVLGWHGYAPWLYVYSAMAQTFKEGWIPDNYYGKVVLPKISADYGKISDLKPLTGKLIGSDLFPDLCSYVNGLWLSTDHTVLRAEDMKEILFANTDVAVFKVDNSLQGRGVFFFDRSSFDTQIIQGLGNGVFQEYIKQHEFFDALMPKSVATLRITTLLDQSGGVTVRACYLRVGRSADTHVKSTTHIRIPIDLSSGALDAQGYLANWLAVDKHPDSEAAFAGRAIPCFDTCISTALDLHRAVPFVRCIGWDMIVDRSNAVKLIEWNGDHNDIKFSEATQGPCFADMGWEKLWRTVNV